MLLRFSKMHGLGNDFMVIDLVSQYVKLKPQQIRRWGDRHTGIGFDQLLVVEPPQSPDADFRYRIFNADGDEVEQCGNGARCFGRFVHDKKLTKKKKLRVETANGLITIHVIRRDLVSVDMGIPRLAPEQVPFQAEQQQTSYPLDIEGQTIEVGAVSMGNPHAVTLVDDTRTAPVAEWGPMIESHTRFPQRVNAGFMQVISRNEANLRVFERGVGETQACGSGACAAMVSGRLQGLLDDKVTLHLTGGDLTIEWKGNDQSVIMTGPCSHVFDGRIRV